MRRVIKPAVWCCILLTTASCTSVDRLPSPSSSTKLEPGTDKSRDDYASCVEAAFRSSTTDVQRAHKNSVVRVIVDSGKPSEVRVGMALSIMGGKHTIIYVERVPPGLLGTQALEKLRSCM